MPDVVSHAASVADNNNNKRWPAQSESVARIFGAPTWPWSNGSGFIIDVVCLVVLHGIWRIYTWNPRATCNNICLLIGLDGDDVLLPYYQYRICNRKLPLRTAITAELKREFDTAMEYSVLSSPRNNTFQMVGTVHMRSIVKSSMRSYRANATFNEKCYLEWKLLVYSGLK